MLPGWDDNEFWDQVDRITGGVSARGTMNALLRSATYEAADGTFTSLRSAAEEVLERYSHPSYREELAAVIGAQLTVSKGNETFLGCRWLDDAADAAWQIHVRAQFDGASPFRALRRLWEIPS